MDRKWGTRIIAVIIGAMLGAVYGYTAGNSALRAVVGAGIGAVVVGLIALVPTELWDGLRDRSRWWWPF